MGFKLLVFYSAQNGGLQIYFMQELVKQE